LSAITLLDKKEFSDDEPKKAYMKAAKWAATNIVSKDMDKVLWKIEKVKDANIPTFILLIYCEVDTKELFEQRCKACKAFHSSFYINQEFNCDRCNAKGYDLGIKEKLKIVKQYYKEKLNT